MSTARPQALSPLQLLRMIRVIAGAVVARNKVSPLIVPGLLGVSVAGMAVIAGRHLGEDRRYSFRNLTNEVTDCR